MPQQEEDYNSESSVELEDNKQPAKFIIGDCIKLNAADAPCLVKLFGAESIVARSYLKQILLELFKLLGNSSTASVDFEHKNGNKGRANCTQGEE